MFRQSAIRSGVHRRYTVAEGSHFPTPLTIGIFRPVILLPRGITSCIEPADLRAIALHEFAHIRRGDPLTLLLVSIIRAVFFFHPLLRLASRQVSLLAEQACDDAALDILGEPVAYARILTRIAERAPVRPLPLPAGAGMFPGRSIFFRRIEAILFERRTHLGALSARILAILAGVTLLSFILACVLPLGEKGLSQAFGVNSGHNPETGISFSPHAVAYAVPLEGIRIDGKLDDWPKGLVRYPIRNHDRAYGSSDLDDADLDSSDDLSPEMMVGFNPNDNLLYLAVIVRDDSVHVEQDLNRINCFMSDACEVYVDGAHLRKRVPVRHNVVVPVRQYVMCPEGGYYSRFIDSPNSLANPNLAYGDIARTRTACVCTRTGNLTIYEWAVEPYERYPDHPTRLTVGKTIGLDVAVADRDRGARADSPIIIPTVITRSGSAGRSSGH